MRVFLSWAAAFAMILLGWTVDGSAATRKKAAKKTTASKTATARKSGKSRTRASAAASKSKSKSSKTATSRRRKATKPRTTWRNRQVSPTPDRYKEIQGALAAKGFLNPEEATGEWNSTSVAALKRFQANQNLQATGKINSLSLIALGLGPKRDPGAAVPPPAQPGSPATPAMSPQLEEPLQPGPPAQPAAQP